MSELANSIANLEATLAGSDLDSAGRAELLSTLGSNLEAVTE
jgi:hypothetical protein